MQNISIFLQDNRDARGWLLEQQLQRGGKRAWICRRGDNLITYLENTAEIETMKKAVLAEGGEVRDIPSHWVCFPTGFDLQVHLRFPGQESRETLEGGLASAFVGGYDTIVTMPNTSPFLDEANVLAESIHGVKKRTRQLNLPVETLFTAAGTRGMRGEESADIPALVAAGAVAITDDGWGVRSPEAMREIFEQVAACGVPFLQHAEMPGHKGHASASAFQAKHNVAVYPRTAESEMVARDLQILRKIKNARYHVLHISTRETLAEIRRAKDEGLAVTCEVTPHHLFFANSDIPNINNPYCTSFKMNPPLFAPEDRSALVEALQSGLIDCVSTDHAPHTAESKSGEWQLAPFGTRGLETALPVLVTLMEQGKLSPERVREAYAFGGRKVLGSSAVSDPTGLIFADPKHEFMVAREDLPGISNNSCFVGTTLHGRIELRAEQGRLFSRV